ncbi:lysylphosphatidylglycerol synthase transmembrane domain-containing protein [Actinacidiphila sp. bgisy160]|uniref:lysylphosphatidylglycerol synthase transmembrane domain-containing protein n=1 Tax=Actinacidiphila sp. bgisy160 TaxID=3413796 RepID=UPI003D71F4B9
MGAGVIVAGVALLAGSHRQQVAQAYVLISHVRGPALTAAVACEALSLLCFAAVPRRLLAGGGVRWGLGRMAVITMAGNAVAGALPGGAAFAGAWVYRQFSRRGVPPAMAVAVLAAGGALSAAGLTLLVAAGLVGLGTVVGTAALVRPVIGVLLAASAAVAVLMVLSRSPRFRAAVRRTWVSAGRRSALVHRGQQALAAVVEQARSLQPGLRPWLWPAFLALMNWIMDAACLVCCMWALGIAVPWHGLLLAYGLAQLPGSLRLTPGSLGVLEAGLSALLVLYGLDSGSAIAATLLYRAISYWALQPIGWACWTAVTAQRGTPRRRSTGPRPR